MDYLEDEFIEEQLCAGINFTALINNLKSNIQELEKAVEDNNKQKIKSEFKKINEFLKQY
jgi:molecular chaperone DnaK (HSP70)